MRTKALGYCVLVGTACVGCLHAPANFPGAGGDNIDPDHYMDAACPDLSGRYAGSGELLEGDANAQQWDKTMRIDYAFPFANSAELVAFYKPADSDGPDKRRSYPNVGELRKAGSRSFHFSVDYANGKSSSYVVSFENKARFVCTGANGKIVWGGADKGGRSEFGPNSSDAMVMLYLDEQGNLISEETTQIHMSMLFGLIPTGTARYFSKYRYQRIR